MIGDLRSEWSPAPEYLPELIIFYKLRQPCALAFIGITPPPHAVRPCFMPSVGLDIPRRNDFLRRGDIVLGLAFRVKQ